jgi:hypothetical protein
MSYDHLRTLLMIQGREAFCKEEIPGILNLGADREPVVGGLSIRRICWR